MNSAFNGLWHIIKKEIIHILRDPTTLVIALMIPTFQLIIFGFAIDFDIRHIKTVVVDMDNSRESRQFVSSLKNTQYLDISEYKKTPDEAIQSLKRNDTRVALIIPPDFARKSGTNNPPSVKVLLDGSDSMVALPARNAFLNVSQKSGIAAIESRLSVLFNPQMRTQIYMIPGLIAVILQIVTVALTSFSFVKEREQGTLEQLMVSPVGKLGLMVGKIVPYSILAMLEMGFVLIAGWLVFNVHIAGSLPLLLFMSIPFILAALSMGLLISVVAQNQAQALLMTIFTMLPAILLSGYIAPRDTMPGALYLLSNVLPATHFIKITRGIIVRGAGFMDLLPSVLALIVIATVLLTAATLSFRKSSG